jgi:hypothetical protein
MINLKDVALWLKGYDSYELKQRVIRRKMGLFREEVVPIDEVETWTIHQEMAFDVIEFCLKNGDAKIALDYKNDLITILRMNIGAREREAEGSTG